MSELIKYHDVRALLIKRMNCRDKLRQISRFQTYGHAEYDQAEADCRFATKEHERLDAAYEKQQKEIRDGVSRLQTNQSFFA